jgi:hypothetical protein
VRRTLTKSFPRRSLRLREVGSQNTAATKARIFGTDLPDVKITLDSLGVMEEAMRHFYVKAMVEKSAGEHADWKAVDAAMSAGCAKARTSPAPRIKPAQIAEISRCIILLL